MRRRIGSICVALLIGVPRLASAQDTLDSLAPVVAAERRFLSMWRSAWVASEGARHPLRWAIPPTGPAGATQRQLHADTSHIMALLDPRTRQMNARCDVFIADEYFKSPYNLVGKWLGSDWPSRAVGAGWQIRSRTTAFAACPTWYLGPTRTPPWDERVRLDDALLAPYRDSIAVAREAVLSLLDSAVRAKPGNNWLAGQYVRFLIDEQRNDLADRFLSSCRASAEWCAMLLGFVRATEGRTSDAHAAFISAAAGLRDTARCAWSNVSELLEPDVRQSYEALTCAQQDSLNARLWWLADPLWSVPGNEREVEHMARRTLLLLRTALPYDERFNWRIDSGGDARQEMVMRYGWPAFVYWPGLDDDSVHTYDLRSPSVHPPQPPTSPPNEPYVSYEYSPGRLHLVPSMHAVLDPFRAASTDWSLYATAGGDTVPWFRHTPDKSTMSADLKALADVARENNAAAFRFRYEDYPSFAQHTLWWPTEHSVSPFRLTQLPDGITAMLRRRSTIIFATALDLPAKAIARTANDSVGVTLVATSRPDSFVTVATIRWSPTAPIILFGDIPAHPTLIGVEILNGPNGEPAARTRYGVTPPPPLSAMVPGEVAISEPLLLRPPVNAESLPSETSAALGLLAPSDTVPRGKKIGVYWETYGVRPADSVEVAVWIERYTPQGILRRFATRLNIANDLNTPISITWQETGRGRNASVIEGPVPVVSRSIILDSSKLARGDYWLGIAVKAPGREAIRSRKAIVIQ